MIAVSGQLSCQVDARGDVIAVAPCGVLDVAGAAQVRSTLNKALAEAPLAIIVDVAGLIVVDDVCLTVFPSVARRATTEPGTSLVLYGADHGVRTRMAALGIDRRVPVCASREEAVERGLAGAQSSRTAQRFAPVAESVPQARAAAALACEQWHVPSRIANQLQVIVTELASNAVLHARSPYELVLRRSPQFIRVTVLDGDERPARLVGPATPHSVGGRGLLLVEAFATSWGCHTTAYGKSTWATVRYRPLPDVPAQSTVSP